MRAGTPEPTFVTCVHGFKEAREGVRLPGAIEEISCEKPDEVAGKQSQVL